MTSYTEIFELFLNKISDIKMLSLSDEDITNLLTSYMFAAIASMKECKTDLTDVDPVNKCFNNDLLGIEKEIISSEPYKIYSCSFLFNFFQGIFILIL